MIHPPLGEYASEPAGGRTPGEQPVNNSVGWFVRRTIR
jgi:hypothetical protein